MAFDTSRIGSRLDLLNLITREFNTTPDTDLALSNVLSAITAAVGVSDASLFLLNSAGRIESCLIVSGFEVKKQDSPNTEHFPKGSLLNWVRQNKKGAVIADTTADERWQKDHVIPFPHSKGSVICVPIQLPDQLLGILAVTAPRINYFEDNDLALLNIIADHAAIALDNARLLEAEQQRRRLADTLTSIAHTINSTLNLNEALNLILEQLSRVVSYDSSSILLYSDSKDMLAVQAARGFKDMEDALKVKLPFDENSPNYQAILQKKPIVIDDVDTEPHWIKSSSSQQVKSWIGAPLLAQDEVVGILTLDSYEPDRYTPENVDIVAAFADLSATAVANAQAVTRLKHAEATYSALFEDSTDLIIITNYDGLIIDVNRRACQILRRPKDAFIDLDISIINSHLKNFLFQQTKRLQAWREASIEIEVTDAYRQDIPLEIKTRNIKHRGKDCVEWVGRDISTRKQIERMRQDLVNMLVHDLRGPLGNLINTVELISVMMGSTADDPRIQKILTLAKRSGQTLNDMVDSVLDVSRLEEGELPLQRDMTSLIEVLEAVEDQVIPKVTAKQMEITIAPIPEEVSKVWIDRSLIRRVLVNIVGNAVKYTPEKGHVSLTTTVTENRLRFIVSDDGPGISQTDQIDVFNKFSRVDYSVDAPVGVGLGLAFCKLATEAHGGTIWVESEGVPGKGSTFYIELPILQPEDNS